MRLLTCLFLVSSFISFPGIASTDDLFQRIAKQEGVPFNYLKAVCTHESKSYFEGKQQPWPFAINYEGRGYYFKNARDAIVYTETLLALGSSNFDIGMCQVNWRWHGDKFASIRDAFNATTNATIAAQYMKQVKREGMPWSTEIGRYHSMTEERSIWYAKKIQSYLASLD